MRTMKPAWICGMMFAAAVGSSAAWVAKAQQPAPQQKPPFQLLIEAQVGAQAVDIAILKSNNEQLQALVAERDKTIAGLKAELAEAKKEKPQ